MCCHCGPATPVLARPLDGTTGFTASLGDQPPTPLLNRLPQLFPVSQQPGNLPSNGGHINSNPTRSTRNPLRARLAALGRTAYARGQGGGRERRNDRADYDRQLRSATDKLRRLRENALFDELESILATPSRIDSKASTLKGAIDYIKILKSAVQSNGRRVRLPAANTGLVCFDNTGDPNAVTAVATQPAPGSAPSTMASYLGPHVAMHVCGRGCFITITLPYRDPSHDVLLFCISHVLYRRGLVVMGTNFISTLDGASKVYSIQCQQASPDAPEMSYKLHQDLQDFVTEYNGQN
ncbi:hypothetical protein M758_3G035500 [Ceratodon purpureus]|nr:hypothetical protein M758_3G035500 [Ceratodon purpureus]